MKSINDKNELTLHALLIMKYQMIMNDTAILIMKYQMIILTTDKSHLEAIASCKHFSAIVMNIINMLHK